jgi:hypothetical protein
MSNDEVDLKCEVSLVAEISETRQHFFHFFLIFLFLFRFGGADPLGAVVDRSPRRLVNALVKKLRLCRLTNIGGFCSPLAIGPSSPRRVCDRSVTFGEADPSVAFCDRETFQKTGAESAKEEHAHVNRAFSAGEFLFSKPGALLQLVWIRAVGAK